MTRSERTNGVGWQPDITQKTLSGVNKVRGIKRMQQEMGGGI
jgi:hypothetical protein